jgi:surface polysaccharide O-acyltransferase-like enzyme
MARRLLLLNGLAALCLPIFHAVVYGFQAMFLWTDRYRPVEVTNYDQLGSFTYYIMLSVRQLAGFSIPAFIFVSGFFIAFLASGQQSRLTREAIISRIKVLLIPFLIWTAFHFIFILNRRVPRSVTEVLRPYYYIPLVIQFYLLSPLLVSLAKKHWKLLLLTAALLHLALQAIQFFSIVGITIPGQQFILRVTPTWFFPGRIFWFIFGLVFSLQLSELKPWLQRFKRPLLGAMILSGVLSVVEYDLVNRAVSPGVWLGPEFTGFAREFFSLFVLLTFAAFDKTRLPYNNRLNELGVKSLGIYLVNAPAIYVASSLMYHLTPWILGQPILYQGLLFLVGLGVPLLLMAVTFKWPVTRLGYRYLFG